jgi:hypothetical protein
LRQVWIKENLGPLLASPSEPFDGEVVIADVREVRRLTSRKLILSLKAKCIKRLRRGSGFLLIRRSFARYGLGLAAFRIQQIVTARASERLIKVVHWKLLAGSTDTPASLIFAAPLFYKCAPATAGAPIQRSTTSLLVHRHINNET